MDRASRRFHGNAASVPVLSSPSAATTIATIPRLAPGMSAASDKNIVLVNAVNALAARPSDVAGADLAAIRSGDTDTATKRRPTSAPLTVALVTKNVWKSLGTIGGLSIAGKGGACVSRRRPPTGTVSPAVAMTSEGAAADYLGVRIHTGLSWSISLASEVAARRPSSNE